MGNILIKSGWLGTNNLEWYVNSGDLGDHVVRLVQQLEQRHRVFFSGDPRYRGQEFDVEIHIEKQISFDRKTKKILIICEPHFVQPQNLLFPNLEYSKIFQIDSIESFEPNVVKYRYPRDLTDEASARWQARDILISCINANKNSVIRSKYNLYEERSRLIHLLDKKLGNEFHLYGGGWELRDHPVGLFAKVGFRLPALKQFLRRPQPLASYRGKCDSKAEIMGRSKFTLCVENTQYPGCMTEKMIDCFRFGSVPLYLGPRDVGNMIDPSLYFDIRNFDSDLDLFSFMENFTEKDYLVWRQQLDFNRAAIWENHSISNFVEKVNAAVEEAMAPRILS